MASIGRTKNGTTRILFYDKDGYRKAIYLGKCSKDDADKVKYRVESVLTAGILGNAISQDDASWLKKFPRVREKFELVGLVEPTEPVEKKPAPTLAEFLDDYMKRYGATRKPGTRIVWQQVMDNLKSLMPEGIRLNAVTAGHCKSFLEKLRAKEMAESTIHKRLSFCRQFFKDAVDWELISKNPFEAVKVQGGGATTNVHVDQESIDRIMAVAPMRWKVIIALARYGGLRTPSETLSIKWTDVDFENHRMNVPEPKVEHHKGRGVRVCPLFPKLREVLLQAKAEAPEDADYVVDAQAYRDAADSGDGWKNANLRTQFLKLLKKAGVPAWGRLFHSMRASRQTELLHQHPSHVVCKWLGNSPEIARKHYALTTDEDFDRAILLETNTTRAEANLVQKQRGAEGAPSGAGMKKALENTGENQDFQELVGVSSAEDKGFEPSTGFPAPDFESGS
jgi:integrase